MKTQQAIITTLSEMIGENTIYEINTGIKINDNFSIYALFITNEELEIKDLHGRWRKLTTDNGRWATVELDAKDNWREVEHKWAEENEIFCALEMYFELTTVFLQAA